MLWYFSCCLVVADLQLDWCFVEVVGCWCVNSVVYSLYLPQFSILIGVFAVCLYWLLLSRGVVWWLPGRLFLFSLLVCCI